MLLKFLKFMHVSILRLVQTKRLLSLSEFSHIFVFWFEIFNCWMRKSFWKIEKIICGPFFESKREIIFFVGIFGENKIEIFFLFDFSGRNEVEKFFWSIFWEKTKTKIIYGDLSKMNEKKNIFWAIFWEKTKTKIILERFCEGKRDWKYFLRNF